MLWFWFRLGVFVSGIRRLLLNGISIPPLIRTIGFVCVFMAIVSVWRRRVCLREVRRLLVAAWTCITRIIQVSVIARVPVRGLCVSVTGWVSVGLIWKFPSVRGILGWWVFGVALISRIGIGCISEVTPARGGGIQGRLRRRLALVLQCGKADGGRFLVKRQRAVAVLTGENRGGASVARLIRWLALNWHVWLAPTWVVGFEEGAVHKTLSNYETRMVKAGMKIDSILHPSSQCGSEIKLNLAH